MSEKHLRVKDIGPNLSVLLSNSGSWTADLSSCVKGSVSLPGKGWKCCTGMLGRCHCGDVSSLPVGVFLQTPQVAGGEAGVGFPAFSLPGLGGNGGGGNLNV